MFIIVCKHTYTLERMPFFTSIPYAIQTENVKCQQSRIIHNVYLTNGSGCILFYHEIRNHEKKTKVVALSSL